MKRRNFFVSLFGAPVAAKVVQPVMKKPVFRSFDDHLDQDEFGWNRWRTVTTIFSDGSQSTKIEVLDMTPQQALARYGPLS